MADSGATHIDRRCPATVVVVNERTIVRNGLVAALRAMGHDAVGVATADEIITASRSCAIVIDGNLEDLSIDLLGERIHAQAIEARFIMVSDQAVPVPPGTRTQIVDRTLGVAGIADALSDPALTGAGGRAVDGAPVGLSELECAVLRLIAQGATAREAGAALGMSHRSVENHKRRIFDRLGATTQAQAVSLAIRNGQLATLGRVS